MASAITQLGVRPVYPLSETLRLGSVLLVDVEAGRPDRPFPPWQDTSILLTEQLVEPLEMARRSRPPLRDGMRFPQSPEKLASQLFVSGQGTAHYRQTAAADSASSPQGSLSLAAMPGYTLASVDQFSVGALVPAVAQSLLAGLGLRRTSSLRMEALGVEVAEVPLDALQRVLYDACIGSSGVFGHGGNAGRLVVNGAASIFEGQRRGLSNATEAGAKRGAGEPTGYYLLLIRKVFYLRGIRFQISDSEAAAAFAQAALRNTLPGGNQAPTLADVPITRGSGDDKGDKGTAAAIADLQRQVDELRKALAGAAGGNPQAAAQIARATATGIELVHVFDRPLAFGYQPLWASAGVRRQPSNHERATPDPTEQGPLDSDGLRPLCRLVGVDFRA